MMATAPPAIVAVVVIVVAVIIVEVRIAADEEAMPVMMSAAMSMMKMVTGGEVRSRYSVSVKAGMTGEVAPVELSVKAGMTGEMAPVELSVKATCINAPPMDHPAMKSATAPKSTAAVAAPKPHRYG